MSNTKQTTCVIPASCEALLALLETLPGALFIVDDADTIVYANVTAQTLTGAQPEAFLGNSFWRSAPQLVDTALYQAVLTTRQTREPTDVEYVSPVTHSWLHVSLSPTVGGLMLHFHEVRAPVRRQQMFSQRAHLSIDDLDGLHDGIGILTPGGIVLDINEVPLEDAHIRREEVIGQPLAETPWWSCSPASQEQLRAAIARASTGETVCFETLVRPREGVVLHLDVAISPHVHADHHIAYLVIVGIDITARKRAEREIHTLIDAIPQLVWTGRPDGYVDSYNQRWRDYTGLSTEQAQGDGWMQCTHPDDRQRVLAVWQSAVQTGRPYEVEQRLRQSTTGEYRWFLVQATPYKDAQGTILKYVGTCTDIDDQKRAEQQLKESRENWRVLAETVPQLVWTARPDGRIDYTNQWCSGLVQTDAEHLQGYGWSQFLHPDDYERTLAVRAHAFRTGVSYEDEFRLKDGKTGNYRWFLGRALPVRDEAGQIVKWFGTCTDIEDQKRIEEALRQSQERIRALIDSNIIGIISVEEEAKVLVEANEAFLHMTGYTQEDMRSKTLNRVKITSPEQAPLFQRALQEVNARGQHTPFETEVICKDGSRLPVLLGGVTFQECPRQIISFVLDNSARKELEQRKDDFISIASHELRNPLAAVKIQTQLVQKRLERQSHYEAATALSRVEGPVKQLERLIGELLDVSQIQAGRLEYRLETVDLNALLQEITDTMQHLNPSHTLVVRGTVQTSLMADRDRLGQVFTNLISNAIKYSPDAKTVEIDLDASPETVTICVHDHGPGIPREQRDKIFERFYRAADAKKRAIPGLGMGLYIVAEIVKCHGGTMMVDSAVGEGSTFTVTLPFTREALA